MVVTDYPKWHRILRQIGWSLSLVAIVSIVTTALNVVDHPFKLIALPDLTVTILGAGLGLLLSVRTNSAYDRWWEARKLWGQLVNSSRSLARQAASFALPSAPGSAEFAQRLTYAQIAFVHSLRHHLRLQPQPWDFFRGLLGPAFVDALQRERNVPAAILHQMGRQTGEAANAGLINEWRLQSFDSTFTDLANVQGACERIKNTPLPRQYDFYPELFVKAYCFVLPLVLVDELKLWTPLVTTSIAFCFLVLNRIGKNLEDPFENRVYDTPMTSLSVTIEANLRQALGETALPEAMKPEGGVLL